MKDDEREGEEASERLDAIELCRLSGSLGFVYGAAVSLGGAIPDEEDPAMPVVDGKEFVPAGLLVGPCGAVLALRELKLDDDRCRRDDVGLFDPVIIVDPVCSVLSSMLLEVDEVVDATETVC